MPDGTPFKNPDGLWSYGYGGWDETDVRTGPHRNRSERREQNEGIHALTADMPTVIYAIQLADGIIKIGCTADLARRRIFYGLDSIILAFIPGDYAEEMAIHRSLAAHTARGREWYNPVPEVLAVVNDMRAHFNLEPLSTEDAA